MDQVRMEPFPSEGGSDEVLASLVECYREVFAEPPWNEWLKCSAGCGAAWGKPRAAELAAARFAHCGRPVTDYWPHAEVVEDLLNELAGGAVCWLAVERSDGRARVVGFTWGSPIASRWDGFEPELQDGLRREFGDTVERDPSVVYQTELGVLASHRNRGLAGTLAERRNQDFLDRGFRIGIAGVRELPEPSVTFLWYRKLGFRVVHRFPAENGRVVIARELEPGLFRRHT